MKLFIKNRFSLLYAYLAISLIVYAALRILLSVFASHQGAGIGVVELVMAFLTGSIYDISFVLLVGMLLSILLFILPENLFINRWAHYAALFVYYCLLVSLMFTVLAEVVYWEEFFTRFNFIAVDYLIYRHEVTNNIYESYPVVWLLGGVLILAAAVLFATKRYVSIGLSKPMVLRDRAMHTAYWVLLAVISLGCIGQGLRNKFENNFVKEIASNGPFQFFAAFRNNELDYDAFYARGQEEKLSTTIRDILERDNSRFVNDDTFDITRFVDNPGETKRLNVVLISEESLGAASINRYGEKLPLTPFIDKWIQQSMVFDRAYATGTRTTRGLEAITLSIPPTPGRSVVKRPDNNNMYSLGRVFAEHDYDVAYLYGGRGFFDNMNTFFSGNGYRIVDQTMFSDDEVEFSNAWGVDDASLFRKVIQQADDDFAQQQPFFFHVMTVSNHQPFTYPEGKIDLPSGIGRNGGIMYADYSLRKFIESAKTKPWFDDTVFVMIADHTANSSGRIGLTVDKYHIPFLIYSPKHIKPQAINKVVSQIDLAPTLLGLLNMDYLSGFFGENVLAAGYKERALLGTYQKLGLYEDDEVIVLSPQKRVEKMSNLGLEAHIEDINPATSANAEKAIGYYQSASYVLKNRLNRIVPQKSVVSLDTKR